MIVTRFSPFVFPMGGVYLSEVGIRNLWAPMAETLRARTLISHLREKEELLSEELIHIVVENRVNTLLSLEKTRAPWGNDWFLSC